MKTLKSMTDFILTENIQDTIDKDAAEIYRDYALFLKQPLTLGMFVPCDDEGNVWEAPKGCCSGRECGCMGQPVNYFSSEEIEIYYKLEEKVLFKGFEVLKDNTSISKGAKFLSNENYIIAYKNSKFSEWKFDKFKTIEDISSFGIEVTESAKKQIEI